MSFLYNNISHLLVGGRVGRTNTESKSQLKPIPKVYKWMSFEESTFFSNLENVLEMVFCYQNCSDLL